MRQIILLLLLGALSVHGRKGCRQCRFCTVTIHNEFFIDREVAKTGVKAFLNQCATGGQFEMPQFDPSPEPGNCDEVKTGLCKKWAGVVTEIWRLCGNGGSFTSNCHFVSDGKGIIDCLECVESVRCAGNCDCSYCGCRRKFDQNQIDMCV